MNGVNVSSYINQLLANPNQPEVILHVSGEGRGTLP